jgi:hypothetical protein
MEGPDAPMSRQAAVKSYPVRDAARRDLALCRRYRGAAARRRGAGMPDRDRGLARLRDVADLSLQLAHHEGQSVPRHARAVRAPQFARADVPAGLPVRLALAAFPLDADNGIGYVARDGVPSADFPGLGKFPPPNETWYRFLKPTGRGKEIDAKAQAVVKYGVKYRQSSLMPGATFIGRPNGNYFALRWVTPIDADSCFYHSWSLFRRQGWWRTLRERLFWIFWVSWVHDWLFSDQDKRILEAVIPGKELHVAHRCRRRRLAALRGRACAAARRSRARGQRRRRRPRPSEPRMIEFLMVAGAPTPVAPFSHAVACDGWLFVTGQMPTDPPTMPRRCPRGSRRRPGASSRT